MANSLGKQSVRKPTGWNTFYKEVAAGITRKLGPEAKIGKVSTVASKMWRQIGERRKEWKMKAQQLREDLDTEMVTEKWDCVRCGKVFTREKDMKYHTKGCQQCVCGECGKIFTHALYLKRHNLKEHSETFLCETCGKSFSHKHHLHRHSRVHDSSAFVCEICHTKVKTKSNFRRHMSLQHSWADPSS